MKEANKILKQKIDKKRVKILTFKTIKFKTLQKINNAIDAQNAKLSKNVKKIENNILFLEKCLNIMILNNENFFGCIFL